MPRPPVSRRVHLWVGVLACLGAAAVGCGVDQRTAGPVGAQPAPGSSSGQTPQARSADGLRGAIPSTGQAVDLDNAVDIVRAEVRGGEADSKQPTPEEFLWAEVDDSLIQDVPLLVAEPRGLPPLAAVIPPHNPMTRGRVTLGRHLFYDQRLSLDATVSCASCHDPARAWTDNRVASVGIAGHVGARNSPTVLNNAYGRARFWDGRAPSLEEQVLGPIQNKIEMGDQSYRQIIERLRTIPGYREQFRRVFGTDVTLDGVAKAIAAFERTALTGDSPYDRYKEGDPVDLASEDQERTQRTFRHLTASQKRGMALFGLAADLQPDDPEAKAIDPKIRGRARCTTCHTGANFTDEQFHNIGIGFDPKAGRFADLGRRVVTPVGTRSRADRGAFKTPTLRDVDRTAPYMHDGSLSTLEAVVDHYNRGGTANPALDPRIEPLALADADRADLVAFLHALTGRVTPVVVPTLPPGADGIAPDPRAALNHPGGSPATARPAADPHQVAGLR